MPTLNAAGTVRRAIASVLHQTLDDWELLCVDNGSSDETLSLIQETALTDRRVKVLRESSRGAGQARNAGLRSSQGEFVAFLDSDDEFPAPDTLETLVAQARRNSVDICGGSMQICLHSGELIDTFPGINSQFRFDQSGLQYYKNYQFDYGFYRFIYKRRMLLEAGITFPDYRRFQDPPFFVRAMIAAKSFFALQDITYRHYSGHQSIDWDAERVCGLLFGMWENLRISRLHKLHQLHCLTVARLTTEYAHTIRSVRSTADACVARAESRCLSAIDLSMLQAVHKRSLLEYYRRHETRNVGCADKQSFK